MDRSKAPALKPLDTLLAIKVLSLVEGLNTNDRRVAAAVVEHYRRRDGRCDPGLERIASLLGISVRTVMRANKRLEKAGLLRKITHGGLGNRNRYEPNWARFAEFERAWRQKMKPNACPSTVSSKTGQSSHLDADRSDTQTFKSNLPQLTCSKRPPAEETRSAPSVRSSDTHRRCDVAATEAERRWWSDLRDRFAGLPIAYREVIEAITDELRLAATGHEMRCRGSGLDYLLKALRIAS